MRRPTPRIITTPKTMLSDVPYPIYRHALSLAQNMFSRLPDLDVTEIQDQQAGTKIALYLHLAGFSDTRLINYTVWARQPTAVRFEFRRIDYLPSDVRDSLIYQTSSNRLITLRENNFDKVMILAENYLDNLRQDVTLGKLQDGSLPERLAIEALRDMDVGPMMRNTAPDDVRLLLGRKVRFDQWLPRLGANGVAIEVDGGHHYVDIKGRSHALKVQADDADKDRACRQLGIGMVRITAHGRNSAIQRPMPELKRLLLSALQRAASCGELIRVQ